MQKRLALMGIRPTGLADCSFLSGSKQKDCTIVGVRPSGFENCPFLRVCKLKGHTIVGDMPTGFLLVVPSCALRRGTLQL